MRETWLITGITEDPVHSYSGTSLVSGSCRSRASYLCPKHTSPSKPAQMAAVQETNRRGEIGIQDIGAGGWNEQMSTDHPDRRSASTFFTIIVRQPPDRVVPRRHCIQAIKLKKHLLRDCILKKGIRSKRRHSNTSFLHQKRGSDR